MNSGKYQSDPQMHSADYFQKHRNNTADFFQSRKDITIFLKAEMMSQGNKNMTEYIYIDQHFLMEIITKRRNVAMASKDDKKITIYPQTLIECQKLSKICDKIMNLLAKSL